MKYMGSKRRLAKYIAPIIQGFIDSAQAKTYIEPFVGGANMIGHIECKTRCGSDLNQYVIALLQLLADGRSAEIPDAVSSTLYHLIKNHPDGYPAWLVGWAGVCCSYNGVWFSGFAGEITTKEGKIRNYQHEAKRNVTKQSSSLQDIDFTYHSYKNWAPENCVIYCDPPYSKTAGYKDGFNHKEFWLWCRKYAKLQYNNVILVSEYEAPDMFVECLWSKEICSSLAKNTGSKKGIEKLFWVH